MSWLHKFFDLFLGESEEDAERETKPAQIPQQQEVHHPEGQLKRLEDPKIYYEYPKGKFRFPVVPDGYKNHDLRSAAHHRTNRNPRLVQVLHLTESVPEMKKSSIHIKQQSRRRNHLNRQISLRLSMDSIKNHLLKRMCRKSLLKH